MAIRTKAKIKSRGYAREWLEAAQLKQADLVRQLDWPKAKAFAIWHGEQQLTEAILDELAPLVHAKPYELLLAPAEAHRMRHLAAALDTMLKPVQAQSPPSPVPAPPPVEHTSRRKAS